MSPEHPQQPESDPALDRLLASWRVTVPLPFGFATRVWQRIGEAQLSPARSLVDAFRSWLDGLFGRPAWSVGYTVLLLTAGLLGGYLGAREQANRWNQDMAHRYVQSINPYATLR